MAKKHHAFVAGLTGLNAGAAIGLAMTLWINSPSNAPEAPQVPIVQGPAATQKSDEQVPNDGDPANRPPVAGGDEVAYLLTEMEKRSWQTDETHIARLMLFGAMNDARTVPVLMSYLNDPDQLLRIRAVNYLGWLGAPQATDQLIAFSQQKSDPTMQVKAIDALGRIGGPRAHEALFDAIKDTRGNVASQASMALRRGGVKIPADQAVKLLATGNLAARQFAGESVDRSSPPQDLLLFVEAAMKDGSGNVRLRAAEMLSALLAGPDKRRFIIVALASEDSNTRIAAIRAVGSDPWDDVPELDRLTNDPSPTIRMELARLAGKRRFPQAMKWLKTLAEDRNPSIRSAVVGSLRSFATREPDAKALMDQLAGQP